MVGRLGRRKKTKEIGKQNKRKQEKTEVDKGEEKKTRKLTENDGKKTRPV